MGSWTDVQNDEGIEILRKENAVCTVYKFKDNDLKKTAKYNHKNKKEIETDFLTSELANYGTLTTLTAKEAKDQHRGVIRHRLKLREEISEEDALKMLIPAVIVVGLKPMMFPLKHGEDPFQRKEGPLLSNYYFYSWTGIHGVTWVAYLSKFNGDVWFSCNEKEIINWKWVKIHTSNGEILEMDIAPWVLGSEERKGFEYVIQVKKLLQEIKEKFKK